MRSAIGRLLLGAALCLPASACGLDAVGSDHGSCLVVQGGTTEQCVDYEMVAVAQRSVLGAICTTFGQAFTGATVTWRTGELCPAANRIGGCRKEHTTSAVPYQVTTWTYPYSDGKMSYATLADISCPTSEGTKLDSAGQPLGADMATPADLGAPADLSLPVDQALSPADLHAVDM